MITMILDNVIENIKIYDVSNIDRIFVDLEIKGKIERQGHLDTVISSHSLDDIKAVKKVLNKSKLLVRVNPIDEDSKLEIQTVVEYGADIVMLPMFKKSSEVRKFIEYVGGKAKTCLLLETTEALLRIDEILDLKGIDEIHIGLNDLHLALGLDFMFEIMSSDILEYLTSKIQKKGLPYGIGGVGCMSEGILSGSLIIKEHIRLGSSMVILSRSFKKDLNAKTLKEEVAKLQEVAKKARNSSSDLLKSSRIELIKSVREITS